MKRKLFFLLTLLVLCANISYSENYLNGRAKGSIDIKRWNTSNIHYSVHIAGAGDNNLDYNNTLMLIQAAYSTWANVSTANISFTLDPQATGSQEGWDGINGHYWVNPPHSLCAEGNPFWDDPYTPNVIEGASAITVWDIVDDVIIGFDVLYNGNKEWKGWDHLTWYNDVQSVAIHEIGHTLGIDEATPGLYPIPVMTSSADPSSDRRTLKFDDLKAISFLFGGNLIDNETFFGNRYFYWNITNINGKTLTFQPASTIYGLPHK